MYCYEDCLRFKISDLKKLDCLSYGQFGTFKFSWRLDGKIIAEINFHLYMTQENPYIILDYKNNGNPVKYIVSLEAKPSNLRRGLVWYFLCAHTGKRCRQLYLADGYFIHRSALRHTIYNKQKYSKKTRRLFQYFDSMENAEKKLYTKYSKPYYNGKPTKWNKKQMKYLRRLEKSEKFLLRNYL
jgi:hypothetical protein